MHGQSGGEKEKQCRDHTRGTQAAGRAQGHVQALDRRRPTAPAPGTGTGISRATAQAAGTGAGKAHATPGTRTRPIPVSLVPRVTGSAGCLRVQALRGPCRCPVSCGPSPGRVVHVRCPVSRNRRSDGRHRSSAWTPKKHHHGPHTMVSAGRTVGRSRQAPGQGCLRPTRRRRRRPG
jgi:hypothetical protein